MKILLANYRYFISGGPERYMFNLMDQLSDHGHEIIPFSIKYKQNKVSEYSKYFVSSLGNQDQIYFNQQRMTPKTFIKTLSRLFYSKEVECSASTIIDETQPQIAIVLHYLRKMSPSLLVALKKKKIPIIVRLSDYSMICPIGSCLRNDLPCTLCLNSKVNSIKYKCVKGSMLASTLNCVAVWFHQIKGYYKLIDAFVTTNSYMYDMMLKAGWPDEKLYCIPTFTNTKIFCPTKDFIKENYICYAGRIENLKGAHILIDAFIKIKQDPSNTLILKIAGTGSGNYKEKLDEVISNSGIKEDIHLVGKLNAFQLSEFLGKALFSVVPSLWFENLPNSILESYACGTPVIASDIGSLSDSVIEGVTGDLFKPGSAIDLAEKMVFYYNNQTLLGRMSKRARNEAIKKYSPESHLCSLTKLINTLVR